MVRSQGLAGSIKKALPDEAFSKNGDLPDPIQKINNRLHVKVEVSGSPNNIANETSRVTRGTGTLIYRQPRKVLVQVCKTGSCEEKPNILHHHWYDLPQAGIYTTLPLRNKPFANNVLTATFYPSGNLETFSFITEAQAERASAAFAETVGAAGQIVDASRNEDIIKLERKLKHQQLENDLLEEEQREKALLSQ